MPPIVISTILQSEKFQTWRYLEHYFLYDVKLQLLADSRSSLANQKARNVIVEVENLLISDIPQLILFSGFIKLIQVSCLTAIFDGLNFDDSLEASKRKYPFVLLQLITRLANTSA